MNRSTSPIATPAPAATVILVRQKNSQLQIYLLKRSMKSGFMAGKYVFPGGRVDPADTDADYWSRHMDLDRAQVALRLGKSLADTEILPYCVAAIREMFEEAGVLLMADPADRDPALAPLNQDQTTANLAPDWLKKRAVAGRGVLAVSRLFCWSHWITPERMKRRYDTRFFVAEMPANQTCRPDNHETTHGIWVSAVQALAGNMAGQIPLSPPTLVTMQELSQFPDIAALRAELARRSWGAPIMPRMIPLPRETVILEPWDPMYTEKEVPINTAALPRQTLPPGSPFSRIWVHGDICQPVALETS